jgi:hypothetical protein
MGSKGYRLWAMGQLDSNVQRPTSVLASWSADMTTFLNFALEHARAVALQVCI